MFLLNYMPDGFICLIKSQTVSQAELRATMSIFPSIQALKACTCVFLLHKST